LRAATGGEDGAVLAAHGLPLWHASAATVGLKLVDNVVNAMQALRMPENIFHAFDA
jgi:hypothetical protein